MVLKTGSFVEMANDIRDNDSKIVIFGTGVVGKTITPEILWQYNLTERILCYVDNDSTKWKDTVEIFNNKISINPPDILNELPDNIVVLIAISRYKDVYSQLEKVDAMKKTKCYIVPELCVENFRNNGGQGVIKTSNTSIIPKVIHYMWFGGKRIPDNLQHCIESWKKYCPDYEIVRWDETNYDVHKNIFLEQAFENKKYGFIPDYARLDILYEHGGIYLDTDVEILRNIDELLYQEAFCSVEKWQVLNFGGCSGAVKGHHSLKPFIDTWKERTLVRSDGLIDNVSSGLIDTKIALNAGYKVNGKNQTIMGMNVYTYDYFHPYDYMTKKLDMTDDTFSIHHFNGGWL